MSVAGFSDQTRATLPPEVQAYIAGLESQVQQGSGQAHPATEYYRGQGLIADGSVCSDEVIARLGKIGIATLIQNVQRLGVHRTFLTGIVPRTDAQRFAGRARTLRCLPNREDVAKEQAAQRGRQTLHFQAYEHTGAGEVLVIDARGEQAAAIGGDLLVARLKANGAAALVTDGAIRDLPGVQEVGFPVFTKGVQAATFNENHMAVDINVPVQCAGVLVRPGDILVGDGEGVLVIPPAIAAQLVDAAEENELRDSFLMQKIMAGEPLAEAFPPRERVLAEYETWRKQQGR
jgi:5-oxopent-3-ene-1,2,5-tricarboxylate decarboxylase / 2-hydroxyhepta-2,4-diene-1,7-dioate isomerase